MKILIIALAGIGDALMATPMIHELKKTKAEIDVLVLWKGAKELLQDNPYIKKIYQINMFKEGFFKSIKFCLGLRKEKYDVSINIFPQARIPYHVVSWLIGAKERIGHNYKKISKLFFTKTIPINKNVHCIENNLNILRALNIKPRKKYSYEIFLTEKEKRNIQKFQRFEKKLKNKNLIGFHVGSGKTKNLALRRWPLENYIELAKKILENKKNYILLFGGPEEKKENLSIINNLKSDRIMLIKTKNIKETAAIIKKCKFFISVDTILMHIAAAMNVPKQIVIETPTFNKIVEPYKKKFILIKNPIVHGKNWDYYKYNGRDIKGSKREIEKIMKSIKVEDVLKYIK